MTRRRLIPAALATLLAAGPVSAQQDDGDMSEGLDLLREGSRMILENLLDDMRPMLDEVRPFFEEEMLPFLEELGRQIDDLTAYELPERLPNGDIIIRRSPDAPPLDAPQPEVGDGGEVEL
ncbi:ATPase of the AAA+ class [Roseibacterium elongatum DSM 19469]|uniref:ATPase of the AAA+ class n=1 Tax=Roseicyclus elongatus DSM 19469 TaxID=1294273 RepID=W8RP28_9RHOB|nr:hypothetical protein [Roseibacterium elongatum]AHM02768.1 ATPase of the AAA+ class [Roseibacterium elongatum DSM 19469]